MQRVQGLRPGSVGTLAFRGLGECLILCLTSVPPAPQAPPSSSLLDEIASSHTAETLREGDSKAEPSSDRPWLRHTAEPVGAHSGGLFICEFTGLQGCSHSLLG